MPTMTKTAQLIPAALAALELAYAVPAATTQENSTDYASPYHPAGEGEDCGLVLDSDGICQAGLCCSIEVSTQITSLAISTPPPWLNC